MIFGKYSYAYAFSNAFSWDRTNMLSQILWKSRGYLMMFGIFSHVPETEMNHESHNVEKHGYHCHVHVFS